MAKQTADVRAAQDLSATVEVLRRLGAERGAGELYLEWCERELKRGQEKHGVDGWAGRDLVLELAEEIAGLANYAALLEQKGEGTPWSRALVGLGSVAWGLLKAHLRKTHVDTGKLQKGLRLLREALGQ